MLVIGLAQILSGVYIHFSIKRESLITYEFTGTGWKKNILL